MDAQWHQAVHCSHTDFRDASNSDQVPIWLDMDGAYDHIGVTVPFVRISLYTRHHDGDGKALELENHHFLIRDYSHYFLLEPFYQLVSGNDGRNAIQ